MGFFDVFKKLRGSEETVELPEEAAESNQRATVKIDTLQDFVDTERVGRLVNEGNIVLLKVGELQAHDLGEFKNCMVKLKRLSGQFGWDIVMLEEGYLILTPKFAKVAR